MQKENPMVIWWLAMNMHTFFYIGFNDKRLFVGFDNNQTYKTVTEYT